jgi:outer membrane protein assembly factor BamA
MRLNHIVILLLSFGIFSCKVSNKIPPQKRLFGGSEVKVIKHDSLSGGEIPEFNAILEDATRPLPNTMIFGWPYKVAFNFFLGEKKKETGLKEWLRKKMGEDPVYIDSYMIDQNITNLTSLLHSYGYFNAKVKGDFREKKVMGYAKYQVEPNKRFEIDSTIVDPPTQGEFGEDFFSFSQNFKLPKYFDLEKIKTERQSMYNSMRNIGYYYFKPDFINILLDSTQKTAHLVAQVTPRNEIPTEAKKRYQINNIYVNIDNPTTISRQPEGSSVFNLFKGLVLNDPNGRFKEQIFSDAIAFRPGTLYNNDAVSLTNNRLLGLGNFKYMQSQFNVVNLLDSTLIDVYYNLQTNKKQTINFETNALSRSSGLAGSQLIMSWANKNLFKGAEQLRIGVNGNFEFQLGGNKTNTQYNENYRTGASAELIFPRFIAPFIKIDPEQSKILPKTILRLNYENFIKKGLYNLNSATARWGYAWTRGRGIEHSFFPMTFNFVKSSNLSSAFIQELFYNPNLFVILENQFILGSSYEINYSPIKYKRSQLTYRGGVDAAGTLLALYDGIFRNAENRGKFFNETYSQFVRVENEVRYRYDFSRDLSWANRGIVNVGVPYGNSLTLPFVRQFFVGGNNSLRGFRARGVGPGSYNDDEAKPIEKFLGTNTGDIKLEFSTEMRYKVSSLINLAAFVDAGNIWMYKEPLLYDERAVFSKNFMKEMAVSGGIGFRFDFNFVIFRIDVATPFRKPGEEEKNRWVFDQIKLGKKDWRQENIVWNFAVGLPF